MSTGFSRQECWSGLSFPSPGDLPGPGIECASPALQVDSLPSEPPWTPPGRDMCVCVCVYKMMFTFDADWTEHDRGHCVHGHVLPIYRWKREKKSLLAW